MILSNTEIHRALDDGRLIISPEPSPRFPETAGIKCPYQTSAVDLRLGTEISFFRSNLAIDINLQRGGFMPLFGGNSEKVTITPDQPFVLKPQKFVLGKTRERVSLPFSQIEGLPSLSARIEGRSSYARCGLLVHFTAPTIHAGFEGTITLELINLGPQSISLYPDAPICQLIVETVLGTPFRNDSQFQGQSLAGGGSSQ
ncbi:MAG: dCTP deaminase [Planctomycetaceae bacterium]